jgi:ribosome biogenesis GTPase
VAEAWHSHLLPQSNLFLLQEGIVIKSTGSWYQVRVASDEVWNCRIIGKFRTEDKRLTNPIAVGDVVQVETDDHESETGIIRAINPRRNYVVRQSPRKKHALHLLASNIDQAIVVVTVAPAHAQSKGLLTAFC